MTPPSHSRIIIATVALAALAITPAAAPGQPARGAAAKRISGDGVGRVKLGKTFRELRRQGLVGRLRPGCELAENTRSARLKAPLSGFVNFTTSTPRKVTDITVFGGAKARGVGIGATIAQIKAAFPKARVDHSQEDVFELTFVKVPKSDGGKFWFAVDIHTHKTTRIGIPFTAFCE
jgi:hypothetical protein